MAKAQSLPIKGKKGAFLFLNKISKITSKKTEMIKYSEDVKKFISNYFFLKGDEEVKVLNNMLDDNIVNYNNHGIGHNKIPLKVCNVLRH